MTHIAVLISQFTPSQPFCFTLQCPNKGCKQHSQHSDLILEQEPSSELYFACSEWARASPVTFLSSFWACRVKRYTLIGLSLMLCIWLSLRWKTWQNWPTWVLFSPPLTQQPNGLLWFTCPCHWGQVSVSVCCREWWESASRECAGRNACCLEI